MNRVWPSRIRWYSASTGSLTLRIRSPVPQTSSAVSRIVAPGGDVVLVGDGGADAGVLLDEDLVAVRDELVHAGRRDGHAVLVVLDLAGDADLHGYQRPSLS